MAPSGAILFCAGDRRDTVMLLEFGQVRLFVAEPCGAELTLDILAAGDVLCAAEVVSERRQAAHGIAMTRSRLRVVDGDALRHAMTKDPGLALDVAVELGRQTLEASSATQRLALGATASRMAAALEWLAERHGRRTSEGTLIDLRLSQSDLAAVIGVSRETANRALAVLRRNGCITCRSQFIVIHDHSVLLDAANTA